MEQRIRESFHLIWLAAIALCVAAALFALVFGSLSRGGADAENDEPAAPASAAISDTASTEPAGIVSSPAESAVSPAESTNAPANTPEPYETYLPLPEG